jgi:uncharacterized protein
MCILRLLQQGRAEHMMDIEKRAINTVNKITYLDGARLHRALVAGIQEVISRQDYLNRINVFPVPDRDTGTNMALTLNTVIEETSDNVPSNISEMLENVADAALNGARGNSGAILAQFFQGLSDGAEGVEKMTLANFVRAVNKGVTSSHQALSEPKEGTILTVLSAFGNALKTQLASGADDFIQLLEPSIQKADEALAETANQLKEMRKAKVVDAGAQGFVDLLHGVFDFIRNGRVSGFYDNLSSPKVDEVEEHVQEMTNSKFRFCTECLIKGDGIDHSNIRSQLNDLGDCLIVAGSARKTKIHVHTNDPAEIFQICKQHGLISGTKADDMVHQQQTINHDGARIAIMTDSGADIPKEIMDSLDIHMVPISVNFGDQSYIDKISMTPDQFYKELVSNPVHPTTSQPSFGDFNRTYQFVNSHYNSIVSIHIPRAVSGTLGASEAAAKRIHNHTVSIVDSKNATAALGLVVTYAAEAAKMGFTQSQILRAVDAIIPKTKLFAAIPNLDYLVKGGRITGSKKRMIDALRLTPVITIDEEQGNVKVGGVIPGRKNLPKKVASFIMKKMDLTKTYRLVVIHCDRPEQALELQKILKKAVPKLESCHLVSCGSALGVHAGPGALGVGIQEYTPPTR